MSQSNYQKEISISDIWNSPSPHINAAYNVQQFNVQ